MSETLRLLCPQWQGAGTSSVRQLAAEFPFEVARRGYAVGTAVLDAILPPADGLTTTAPVAMGDEGLELVDGVEAKAVVVDQLARSLQVIEEHDPERIVTLGGDCAVSVAPFSWLTRLHGDDLAVLWIDSHPDIGTRPTAEPRRGGARSSKNSPLTHPCDRPRTPVRGLSHIQTGQERRCDHGALKLIADNEVKDTTPPRAARRSLVPTRRGRGLRP